MTASAVSTPHPPTVVSTTTFGPAGSGVVANVAAASNASSTVVGACDPGLPAHPGEDARVAGE